MKISFNRPTVTGKELAYVRQALDNSHISGDGAFTQRCHDWLRH
jgi:dTDP-4-amino-4,6-dideoxygalactose transaminase